MNKVKKHYEIYWSDKQEEFGNYARNKTLTSFFNRGEYVLDVGCGDGVVDEYLQKNLNLKMIGIDISRQAVEKARKRGVNALIFSSEEKLPFDSNIFDAVFWGDNIEHLFDPLHTAKEIKRVLKKGGRLILSCPNMGYWRYRIYYLLKGSLPDTEWTNLPPWAWSHIRFFNLNILERFVKDAGFSSINKVVGVNERRLDKPFLKMFPSVFGMIIILEVI